MTLRRGERCITNCLYSLAGKCGGIIKPLFDLQASIRRLIPGAQLRYSHSTMQYLKRQSSALHASYSVKCIGVTHESPASSLSETKIGMERRATFAH